MAVIVVGGQAKHVGKTKLACQIISSFPDRHWIAIKIAGHIHQPVGSELRKETPGFSIWEQVEPLPPSDTARFLEAGARRALLLCASEPNLLDAWTAARALAPEGTVILESTRAPLFLKPDLFLLVLDPAQPDYKDSARQQLGNVDAIVWNRTPGHVGGATNVPSFLAQESGLELRLQERIQAIITAS
ncbi:MAG: hypothetical protein JOZ10_02950 [Acidobacteria bacterium]|nr:hypothetical protein [Acidobacteriota bacterium]